MKKAYLMCLFLAASMLYATNSHANQLVINNGKNCQFNVTLLFASASPLNFGIGTNSSVTVDFDVDDEHVIGAIFYDATTGAPAFTIGVTPAYTPFGMGTVANCSTLVFCTWSQTPLTPSSLAILTIS